MEADHSDETIEVRFVTQQEKWRVTDKPFRVPADLARIGLSGVINHLLNTEKPVPFDFLIENEFLRTTLDKFLQERGIPKEGTITLEYVEAVTEPNHDRDYIHEDWISSVDGSFKGFHITGSYDGAARIWNSDDGTLTVCCTGHSSAIKSVAVLNDNEDDTIQFATASKDQTVRVWKAEPKNKSFKQEFVCRGHSAAVETVAPGPNNNSSQFRLCSGGWDNSIILWNSDEQTTEPAATSSKKKRKTNDQPKFLAPVTTLNGHTQCVSCVLWPTEKTIISASWDHSIKTWDVETSTNTSLNGTLVVHSMSYNPRTGYIVTGHSDNIVRIWDTRVQEGALVSKILKSHKGWVSSVCWHPHLDNVLLSGSYDGTVKLWDTRSFIPLQTMKSRDKIFCVDWDTEGRMLFGGANKRLQVWSANLK